MQKTKFLIVTGGVLSGLGKGTATAAIARLLKDHNKVVTVKCDGYLNVDPGTMNPVEHGEVFVLDDGGEVDMDFGHYERFLGINCKSKWNLTSGKVFGRVIAKERKGEYLGKTIQIFPHVTDEVKAWWREILEEEKPDVMTIEVGGTVGDIENAWFLDAARQWKKEVGAENVMYVHLTYVPFLESVGEPKTKAAQRDIALLREKGITPDAVICRSTEPIPGKIKEKISLFCDVDADKVIGGHDVKSIYEIPLMFREEGLLDRITEKLGIKVTDDLAGWRRLVAAIRSPEKKVKIAVCGKYTDLRDSYASILEALTHAGAHGGVGVEVDWVETTDIEGDKISVQDALKGAQGVLVPGGFGSRGVEGKIQVIKYARENNIPYLGICYGLQLAVVEFARSVCNLKAHTTEADEGAESKVVDILPEQREVEAKGGTMRLGACVAVLKQGSLVQKLYNAGTASERHRHRFEVNPEYHEILQKNGLVFSGTSKDGRLVEFVELPNHPYFVASQAHNELTSRLEEPNPLFLGFVQAASKKI